MTFKISGFGSTPEEKKNVMPTYQPEKEAILPRKSVVQVRFPSKETGSFTL